MPTTIVSFRQRLGRRYGGYEDALFEQRMLDVIERHEPSQPLFLFWAPHSVHTPYEVPGPFMERFDFIAGEHDRLQTTRLAGCVFTAMALRFRHAGGRHGPDRRPATL